jgi:CheY-like chemotaxis protein
MAEHVLVVDDNEFMRKYICRLLEMAGYIASVAISGLDAIEQISNKTPDLIVLDVLMPGVDGIRFMRYLRSINNSSKVIAISGGYDPSSDCRVEFSGLVSDHQISKIKKFLEYPADNDLNDQDGNCMWFIRCYTGASRQRDFYLKLMEDAGADYTLKKPFSNDEFLFAVKNTLASQSKYE